MKKILNEKGFTLMELMIVVAIIAVLAAIALPMVSGAVDKARDAALIADVRSVAGSLAVYAANEDKTAAEAATQFNNANTAENKSLPKTVEILADGTVKAKVDAENNIKGKLRTDKMGNGLSEGDVPCIPFGGSLQKYTAP